MATRYVTYAHRDAPGGTRFRQRADIPEPDWAVDVRPWLADGAKEVTNNLILTTNTWLELEVHKGSNIFTAAREMAALATEWGCGVCADINGRWLFVSPGTDPEGAVNDLNKMIEDGG